MWHALLGCNTKRDFKKDKHLSLIKKWAKSFWKEGRIGKVFVYSFCLHRRSRFNLSKEFCFRNLFNSSVVLNVKHCIFLFTIPIYHFLGKKIQKHKAKKNTEKQFFFFFIFLTR